MGTSKRTELATAIALIVAGAATALPAEAQSSLPVYSSDFGGPNSAAPAGASRDTVIAMGVPRLQAVYSRLLEVRRILQTHSIPAHDHPHSHGVCVTPGDGDGVTDGETVVETETGATETGATETEATETGATETVGDGDGGDGDGSDGDRGDGDGGDGDGGGGDKGDSGAEGPGNGGSPP